MQSRYPFLLVLLGFALLVGSCDSGNSPTGTGSGAGVGIGIQPALIPTPADADALPINRVSVRVARVSDGLEVGSATIDVDPNAAQWTIDLTVPEPFASASVHVFVRLFNVAADGTQAVQFSGRSDPVQLVPGERVSPDVPVVRGPVANLFTTGVTITSAPATMAVGGTATLAATATTSGTVAPTTFWTSLAPAVVGMSGAVATAVGGGTAEIVASAGSFADTVTVQVFPTLQITTATLPDGVQDGAYSEALAATGGDGSYSWAVGAGALPDGLTLDTGTGVISGTPTTVQAATFEIDVSSAGLTAVRQFTVQILDDVPAGFTIAETGGSTEVDESGTTDTFNVVLDAQPLTDVVLNVASANTAEATVSPATLTFTNGSWDTPQTVTVTGVDDAVLDGAQSTDITVSVDAAASDDSYDPVPDQIVSVTTTDDEVPSGPVVRWANAASGNWSQAPNWNPARVPQPGDSVVIDAAGTYTVTLDQNANVQSLAIGGGGGVRTLVASGFNLRATGPIGIGSGGAIEVGQADTLASGSGVTVAVGGLLDLNASTVDGDLDVNEVLVINGGTTVTGNLTTGTASDITVQGEGGLEGVLTVQGSFTNSGQLTLTDTGGGYGTVSVSGGLINETTGTITAEASAANWSRFIFGVLDNRGAITVDETLSIAANAGTHLNSGTISVQDGDFTVNLNQASFTNQSGGSIELTGAGDVSVFYPNSGAPSFTQAGTITIALGRTLSLFGAAGSFDITGGTVVNDGTLSVGALAAINAGAFTQSGTGTLQLNTTTWNGSGALTNPAGATLQLLQAVINADVENLGTVSVFGANITGQLIVPSSDLGTFVPSSGNATIRAADVDIDGALFDGVSLEVNGSTLTRLNSVDFQNQSTTGTQLWITHPGAGSPFTLDGLSFTQPTSNAYVRADDSNSGDGNVLTINLTNSDPVDGSAFTTTNGGAVVNWVAPAANLNRWTGAGDGITWEDAANWSKGAIPVPADSVVIDADGTYTVVLASDAQVEYLTVGAASGTQTFFHQGGVLTIDSAASFATNTVYEHSNATMTGAGSVTIDGVFNWSQGTIAGTGTTTLTATATGTWSFSSRTLDTRTVTNEGYIQWDLNITLANGATFVNDGTLERIGGTNSGFSGGANGTFINNGTFIKTGAASSNFIDLDFINNGVVDVQSQTLTISGNFTHADGAVLQGTGNIFMSTATVLAFDGDVSPGQSPGFLATVGAYGPSALSALVIELEGTVPGTGYDRFHAGGVASLAGDLVVDTISGFEPSPGDSFAVFTMTSRTGDFDSVTLPSIAGLALDTAWAEAGTTDTLYVVASAGPGVTLNSWTGGGDGSSWGDASNWSNGVPTASDSVVIDLNGLYGVTLDQNVSVQALTVGDGTDPAPAVLTDGFTLATSGNVTVNTGAVLQLTNTTLTVGGALTNSGNVTLIDATIIGGVLNQAVLTARGVSSIAGALSTTVDSEIYVQGNNGVAGLLTTAGDFTNSGIIELTTAGGAAAPATLTVPGTLTNASGATIRAVPGLGGLGRFLIAELDNQGTVEVSQAFEIGASGADHTNSGLIQVVSNNLVIPLDGGWFTNEATGVISVPGGGVQVQFAGGELFINDGNISVSPGASFSVSGSGNLDLAGGVMANGGTFAASGGSLVTSNSDIFVTAGDTVSITGATWGGPGILVTQAGGLLQLGPATVDTDLEVHGTVEILAASAVGGQLIAPDTTSGGFIGSGFGLSVTGLNVDGATFDDVPLTSVDGTIVAFDNVTFQGMDATVSQLTVAHPGAGTPFIFDGLTFSSAPTSGFYVTAVDNVADANTLELTLTNSSPADGSTLTEVLGGAIVNWGGGPPANLNRWLGGSGTSWSEPDNWSKVAVPVAGDSVVIDLDGTYTVTLDTDATVASLTLGGTTGVQTLSTSNFDLTVTGTLGVQGTGTLSASNSILTTGNLTNAATNTITLLNATVNGDIDNAGTLLFTGANTIADSLTTQVGSELTLSFFNNQTVTFANGFENNGTLTLTNSNANQITRLLVSSGTLVNTASGTITTGGVSNGTPLTREIDASLTNLGTMTLNHAFRLDGSLETHTISGPITMVNGDDFEVASAVAFTLADTLDLGGTGNADFTLGTGTGLVIASNGFIDFGPGQTLSVTNGTFSYPTDGLGTGALVLASTDADFDAGFDVGTDFESLTLSGSTGSMTTLDSISHSGGTLTVTSATLTTGTGLTNVAGQTITLLNATVNGDIDNAGTLLFTGANTIADSLTTQVGSELTLSFFNNQTVTFANGFENNGTLTLTNSNANQITRLLVSSGTLVNTASGTITTGGVSNGTPLTREIDASLTNLGTMTLNHAFRLDGSLETHTISGPITMVNGDDFEVASAVAFTLADTLDLGGTGNADFTLGTGTGLVIEPDGRIEFGPGQTLSVTNGTFSYPTDGLGTGALVLASTDADFDAGFDVGTGFESLTLSGSTGSMTTLDSISHSGGTLTVTSATLTTGTGLTNVAGQTITLLNATVNGDIDNAGTLLFTGANTIADSLTTQVGSELTLSFFNNQTVTFANGFENNGTLTLTNSNANQITRLLVSSGTLVNTASGTITTGGVSNGTPSFREIDASLTNLGTMTLNHAFRLDGVGETHSVTSPITMVNGDDFEVAGAVEFTLDDVLDMSAGGDIDFTLSSGTGLVIASNGFIDFGPGQTLTTNGGTFTYTAVGAQLGTGALALNNTATTFGTGFDVGTDFESLVLTSGSMTTPSIDHSGGTFTVTSATLTTTVGGLTNTAAQTITLLNATVNGDIDNAGTLLFTGANTIADSLTTQVGSELTLSFFNNQTVTFANGFENNGTITLTNSNANQITRLLVSSGTLVNTASGTITTGGVSNGTPSFREIDASLTNLGTMTLNHAFRLDGVGETHSVTSPITMVNGDDFEVAGAVEFTLDDVLDMSAGGDIDFTLSSGTGLVIASNGFIDFGPGQTLTTNGGTFTYTAVGAQLGTGALALNNTATTFGTGFDVGTDFESLVLTSGSMTTPSIDHSGGTFTVTSATLTTTVGGLTNTAAQTITLLNATVNGDIDNAGTLLFTGANTIADSLTTQVGSELTLSFFNNQTVTFANGFENNGTITLTNSNANQITRLLVSSGTLVNTASGTITTGGVSNGTPSFREIEADVETSGTITLTMNMTIDGQLLSPSSDIAIVDGTGGLFVTGLDVDGATFDGVTLTTTNGTIATFDNVTFQNMASTDTQLTVVHNGLISAFVFDGIAFDPLTGGDTGFYISATDNGGANVLTITFTNTTPANGPSFEDENGAVINWT